MRKLSDLTLPLLPSLGKSVLQPSSTATSFPFRFPRAISAFPAAARKTKPRAEYRSRQIPSAHHENVSPPRPATWDCLGAAQWLPRWISLRKNRQNRRRLRGQVSLANCRGIHSWKVAEAYHSSVASALLFASPRKAWQRFAKEFHTGNHLHPWILADGLPSNRINTCQKKSGPRLN